jgi:hypothetical protein
MIEEVFCQEYSKVDRFLRIPIVKTSAEVVLTKGYYCEEY